MLFRRWEWRVLADGERKEAKTLALTDDPVFANSTVPITSPDAEAAFSVAMARGMWSKSGVKEEDV